MPTVDEREYQRKYYAARREALTARYKKRYAEEPEFRLHILAGQRRRYANNLRIQKMKKRYRRSGRVRAMARARAALSRLKRDDAYLAVLLRSRLYFATKKSGGKRKVKALDDLGCSLPEFRSRLERLFLPGMTWDNFGSLWHIDHVVPFWLARPLTPDRLRKLCHYTNLRPLLASDNRKRNCKSELLRELRALGLLSPDGELRFPCDFPSSDSRGLTKPEVDCGAIAKLLGGGGHRGAAGFICGELPWKQGE